MRDGSVVAYRMLSYSSNPCRLRSAMQTCHKQSLILCVVGEIRHVAPCFLCLLEVQTLSLDWIYVLPVHTLNWQAVLLIPFCALHCGLHISRDCFQVILLIIACSQFSLLSSFELEIKRFALTLLSFSSWRHFLFVSIHLWQHFQFHISVMFRALLESRNIQSKPPPQWFSKSVILPQQLQAERQAVLTHSFLLTRKLHRRLSVHRHLGNEKMY